ncbi:MAG: hypothetical protein JWM82_2375 [Myxococcales bacterium]|nr:hypothetical protein [Myxococcales bacterium]
MICVRGVSKERVTALAVSSALLLAACGSTTKASPRDGQIEVGVDGASEDRSLGAESPADERGLEVGDADAANDRSETVDAPSSDRAMDGAQVDSPDGSTPACGTLANTASPVTATMISSLSRNFVGGALTDGIYELVRAEETLSSAPAMFWRTFQIRNGGTEFAWVIQDVGLPPEHHFAGGLKVMGQTLVMTESCVGQTLTYPYDAPGNELTLYYLFGQAGGRIFHYRARP